LNITSNSACEKILESDPSRFQMADGSNWKLVPADSTTADLLQWALALNKNEAMYDRLGVGQPKVLSGSRRSRFGHSRKPRDSQLSSCGRWT
jgi:hypothetical protein